MALPGLESVEKLIENTTETGGYHVSARTLIVVMSMAFFIFLLLSPRQTFNNLSFLLFFAPLWMPLVLGYFAFQRFFDARRAEFIKKQQHVLLELRLPRETKKSPLAMETVLASLNFSSGETTWYKKYWKGGARPWWSLEIASLGGQVRFYIWTRASLRRGLESYFYAQYPGIEIIEAEDYSRVFDPSDRSVNSMFGAQFYLGKEDPYPIKTYVDYGLDKPGLKPEEQVDPLAQLLELMGSIGPKEQFWLQLIIRQTRKEKLGDKDWRDQAKEVVEEIRSTTTRRNKYVDPETGEVREFEGFPNPTKGQSEMMAAIEKNISKPGFDVGVRAIYASPQEAFEPSMITYLINMFRPFNNESYNNFKLSSLFSAKFNDYPWEDPAGKWKQKEHEHITEFYRRRAYFHSPYVGRWMVLSTEELATLYHVPSSTVETPSMPRIQSATRGAPANLPT